MKIKKIKGKCYEITYTDKIVKIDYDSLYRKLVEEGYTGDDILDLGYDKNDLLRYKLKKFM